MLNILQRHGLSTILKRRRWVLPMLPPPRPEPALRTVRCISTPSFLATSSTSTALASPSQWHQGTGLAAPASDVASPLIWAEVQMKELAR